MARTLAGITSDYSKVMSLINNHTAQSTCDYSVLYDWDHPDVVVKVYGYK